MVGDDARGRRQTFGRVVRVLDDFSTGSRANYVKIVELKEGKAPPPTSGRDFANQMQNVT